MNENETHLERRRRLVAEPEVPSIEKLLKDFPAGEPIPWQKIMDLQRQAGMSNRDFKMWLGERNVLAVKGKQVVRKADIL